MFEASSADTFVWFPQVEGLASWRMLQRRCTAWGTEWSSWKRYLRNKYLSSALWCKKVSNLDFPSVQKLQLVLAPFTSGFPLSLDEGLSEKTTLLSHSFQQLDRIDSLSEQIGFLEERLGTCEWHRVLTQHSVLRVLSTQVPVTLSQESSNKLYVLFFPAGSCPEN